jgi:diazepam-binding inhibitor (GABA receptor modulating acyl-CoA-binding protein)
MSLEAQFEEAAKKLEQNASVAGDLPNEKKLEIYSLFKQAKFGDADDSQKPGMLDFKGKAKFEAWKGKKGTSKEDAMKAYVELIGDLLG